MADCCLSSGDDHSRIIVCSRLLPSTTGNFDTSKSSISLYVDEALLREIMRLLVQSRRGLPRQPPRVANPASAPSPWMSGARFANPSVEVRESAWPLKRLRKPRDRHCRPGWSARVVLRSVGLLVHGVSAVSTVEAMPARRVPLWRSRRRDSHVLALWHS